MSYQIIHKQLTPALQIMKVSWYWEHMTKKPRKQIWQDNFYTSHEKDNQMPPLDIQRN